MPIILPHPLEIAEVRVLQEFRRLSADVLPVEKIRSIRHPSGGGEGPAFALIDKGYLSADAGHENFSLTDKAKAFLAIDYKPESESPAADE